MANTVRPMPSARRRLVGSALVGTAVDLALAARAPWQVAVLGGFCAAATGFLTQVLRTILRADATRTHEIATVEDNSRLATDATLTAAAGASLIGVGFILLKASESSGFPRTAAVGLGALSVILAWATVQTVFTLRYARLYYDRGDGVQFNEDGPPDYRDFAYLAFTVGMTYQVSDTNITTRPMRRTVLRHALLSYLFGTAFIAVMINLVAGLTK